MRALLIIASATTLLAACGKDTAEVDRGAEEELRWKRQAELEAKQALMAEEREQAAARAAELEAARRKAAEEGQGYAIGPIEKVADKEIGAIVDRAVELMGGKAVVTAIATLSGRAQLTGAVEQAYDFAIEYPDKMVVDFLSAEDRITRALLVNGNKAYNIVRGRITEFVNPTLEDTLLSIRGDPLCLMIALANGGWGYQLTYLGRADVAGKPADAIRVQPPLSKEILAFFEIETGRLIATRYEMAQGLTTVIDEKFEPVDGVQIGVVSKQIVGTMISTATVTEIRLNPELPAGRFEALQHPLIK
jgi:hypothetical protein